MNKVQISILYPELTFDTVAQREIAKEIISAEKIPYSLSGFNIVITNTLTVPELAKIVSKIEDALSGTEN